MSNNYELEKESSLYIQCFPYFCKCANAFLCEEMIFKKKSYPGEDWHVYKIGRFIVKTYQ